MFRTVSPKAKSIKKWHKTFQGTGSNESAYQLSEQPVPSLAVMQFFPFVVSAEAQARIRGVHDAVVRGNLGEVESVLTRKRFALSRDQLGASPLHLAVLHGHTDIVKYIIDNFPEALDGPDNAGRTPLHYAAVMRDGGSYYKTLLTAGADETVKDKADHTPDYYLTHPGVLSIRNLLEGYRIQERRPSQVNVWQRPPTDEAEKLENFNEDETTPDFSDPPTPATTPGEEEESLKEMPPTTSIYPILFDRQNRDSRYLASVLGDALIKGLTQVANKRPRDPIGYLATYLYQYAAATPSLIESDPATEENTSRKESAVSTEDLSLEFEDHTKMKDEEGQTMLHFAASRVHPDGSFYGLLSHAEVLLAERDSSYRTCRDVAMNSSQEDNVDVIDRFVLDAFLQKRSTFVRMLLHEGYDHLVQDRLDPSNPLLKEAHDFVRKREDLHDYIRKNYLEGVCRIVKVDGSLVTAKGTRGRCALHIAVLLQHLGIIAALVKTNSSAVHVSDNLGRTPLHYAMAMEKIEKIAKILISAGALKTSKDVRMRTPSFYFIYKEEIEKLREEELKLA